MDTLEMKLHQNNSSRVDFTHNLYYNTWVYFWVERIIDWCFEYVLICDKKRKCSIVWCIVQLMHFRRHVMCIF